MSLQEVTEPKRNNAIEALKPYRFKEGNPGRPKGSRNQLGEDFILALQQSFKKWGPETIERVIAKHPDRYLNVIASLMPKQMELKVETFDGMSNEELAVILDAARTALGTYRVDSEGTAETQGSEPTGELQTVSQAVGVPQSGVLGEGETTPRSE